MAVMLCEQLTLEELLTNLDYIFGIVADLDSLTHKLYAIQQGSCESVNHYAMRLNFTLLELSSTSLTAMPQRRIEDVHKNRFLGGLRENIKTVVS